MVGKKFFEQELLVWQVMRPLDWPVQARTHAPTYLMHKYWARKASNVMRRHVTHYTKPGEVVFDPFCGSGVVLAESLLVGRKAVGMDVNPFATELTKLTLEPVDLEELKALAADVKSEARPFAEELYAHPCPRCEGSANVTHVIWKRSTGNELVYEPDALWLACSRCGQFMVGGMEGAKGGDGRDLSWDLQFELERRESLAATFKEIARELGLWYPDVQFRYPDGRPFLQLRHDLRRSPNLVDLFTPRNLLVLAKIHEAIRRVCARTVDEKLNRALWLAFTGSLGQASKMVWVIRQRKKRTLAKPQVGSWTHHFFWNPAEYFEVNALNCFVERVKKVVAGKRYLAERLRERGVSEFERKSDYAALLDAEKDAYMVVRGDARNATKALGPAATESVDFVITDPPYADSIQYYELSFLWNSWLRGATTSVHGNGSGNDQHLSHVVRDEIVVNANQGKGLEAWASGLERTFRCCHRLLKPGRYMVVTFHNTKFKYRNALIRACLNAGFSLEEVVFQHPPRRSLKSYLHPRGSLPGDYYLTFKKGGAAAAASATSFQGQVRWVEEALVELLLARGEPTSIPCVLSALDWLLAKKGVLHLTSSRAFREGVYHSKFTRVDDSGVVHLLERPPGAPPPSRPLSERVRSRVEKFLEKKGGLSRHGRIPREWVRELLGTLRQEFTGLEIPDEFAVKCILRELAPEADPGGL
ncbi:MAG: hypothetical protein Kow0069_00940 [Promethearchaeota archaeon]